MKNNPISIFESLYVDLPYWVASDIYNRMQDWIQMGGKSTDRYMWAQVDYAKKIIDTKKKV